MGKEHVVYLTNLQSRLDAATRFDEVIDVSRQIYFMSITKDTVSSEFKEVARKIIHVLQNHFMMTKMLSFHKTIIKAIVKLSTLCEIHMFNEIMDRYAADNGVLGANCLSAYSRLQNYKLYDSYIYDSAILYEQLIQCSLKYSRDSKFFSLAIENYIQAYDIKIVREYMSFVFTMICTNLENCQKNIHKLLLDLFKKIIMHEKKGDAEIIDVILNKMSWYNRNKHYLLTQIISARPEMLLNHKNFDIKKFMNGLRCGLSQYHLYSSSLSVVKMVYNNVILREPLIELATDIILKGSEYEMNNFIRFWFTCLDDKFKNELFIAVTRSYDFSTVPSTSPFFYRSLIIRNTFNRLLSLQIDNSVKSLCLSIENVNVKLEVFNILLNNIYESKDFLLIIDSILRFLKFINYNMCVQDSLFLDNVMKKLPNFFNHLATSRFRSVAVSREIFAIIRDDLFMHGIDYGTYESKVFSIKLLEVILKQYCGSNKKRRLSKKTDSKNNKEFRNYLKDNEIWDITSVDIFNFLLKMCKDTENSDISGIANEIILEYFIKTSIIDDNIIINGENFRNWIDIMMTENLAIKDVESYHENISYCKMKIEYLIAINPPDMINQLDVLMIDLETRSNKLNVSKDPVNAMECGESVFALIDTINYALTQIDRSLLSKDVILKLVSLMEQLTYQFLEFINDGKTCPSFDLLDKHLQKLVETSSWKSDTCDISDVKHKLLLSFFFTNRALSELSVTLAKIVNNIYQPHQNDYFTALSTCITVNIQILTRFCHKGVIEAASQCLGSITKIVSSEFMQQCDRNNNGAKNLQKLLIMLKHELDCGKRHSSKTGEIRGSRGLVLMSHLIIKNHPPFIKFLIERLLDLIEVKVFYDTQKIKFVHDIQPIHIHLLAIIVKDSELVEDLLPYYDFILISTFRAYKESKDFVMQNALLQIIGNITPKISNHKRHSIEESDKPEYESKAISVYEHYVKFTYAYRIALFDFENNMNNLSQTYIIILLEILSNFEFREPYEYWTEMERMSDAYKKLIDHPCEKIRVLAARCYAQWHLPSKLLKVIKDKIRYIFYHDPNLAHGSIVAVRYMIQRYEASIKFVEDFNKVEFLMKMRKKVSESFQQSYSAIPKNFYLRCHLFDFLMFIGFNFNDSLVKEIMKEENICSKVGYNLWQKRIQEYSDK